MHSEGLITDSQWNRQRDAHVMYLDIKLSATCLPRPMLAKACSTETETAQGARVQGPEPQGPQTAHALFFFVS